MAPFANKKKENQYEIRHKGPAKNLVDWGWFEQQNKDPRRVTRTRKKSFNTSDLKLSAST